MDNMNMENANDHPFKVSIVKDAEFFANSHPYKVTIEGGGGGGNEGRVVDELPEEGEPGYIYLVLKESTPEGDIYDEYMWVLQQDGETYGWEHIGATNEVNIDVVKTLTEDDYNWNRGTQSATEPYNCVAIWLLDDGLYTGSPNMTICPVQNWSIGSYNGIMINRKSTGSGVGYGTIVSFSAGGSYIWSGVNGGVAAFEQRLDNPVIEQTTGQDSTRVMSQKAITDAINNSKGGARLLTSDDYNWNTTTQSATEPYNSVALWLLDAGMYYKNPNSGVTTLLSRTRALANTGGTFIVMPRGMNGTENDLVTVLYGEELNPHLKTLTIQVSDGSDYFSSEKVITTRDVVNNLTNTYSGYALDARQGKVLNDNIGDLSTLTTTAKTSTVDAINELVTTLGNIQTALNVINNGSGN